jgi:hypothetical protein
LSSILKALKKLEEESTPKKSQNQNQPTEHTENTEQKEQKIKKKEYVKRHIVFYPAKTYFFLFSFFLLVIIISVIIIYSTGKLDKKQENSSPGPSIPNPSTPNPSSQSPAANDSSKPGAPAPGPLTHSTTNSSSPALKIEEPVKPLAEHMPAGQTMNGRNENNDHNYEDTNSNEIKNNTPGGLKLTGILWSEIKERRLALINELYLKEGDQVKGISIIRIDKNEVTLQSGVKTWTISLHK